MSFKIEIKPFKKLSAVDIYNILRARSEVFVVEQQSIYLDPDGLDVKAMHVIAYEDSKLAGYCRIVPSDTTTPSISPLKAVAEKLVLKNSAKSNGIDNLEAVSEKGHTEVTDVIPSRFRSRLLDEAEAKPATNAGDGIDKDVSNDDNNDTDPNKVNDDEGDKDKSDEDIDANGMTKGKVRIGRVVVLPKYRGKGLGKQLMQSAIKYCRKKYKKQPIHISAQSYLSEFYESLGFESEGEPYDLNEIEHIDMVLGKTKKKKPKFDISKYVNISTKQLLITFVIIFIIMSLIIFVLFKLAFGST